VYSDDPKDRHLFLWIVKIHLRMPTPPLSPRETSLLASWERERRTRISLEELQQLSARRGDRRVHHQAPREPLDGVTVGYVTPSIEHLSAAQEPVTARIAETAGGARGAPRRVAAIPPRAPSAVWPCARARSAWMVAGFVADRTWTRFGEVK
jgi:hypothetical protein